MSRLKPRPTKRRPTISGLKRNEGSESVVAAEAATYKAKAGSKREAKRDSSAALGMTTRLGRCVDVAAEAATYKSPGLETGRGSKAIVAAEAATYKPEPRAYKAATYRAATRD